MDPFQCNPQIVSKNLWEVIRLKNSNICQISLKTVSFKVFRQSRTVKALYPKLWPDISKVVLCLLTSFLVEAGFSAVNHLLRNERKRLDIASCRDICLSEQHSTRHYPFEKGASGTGLTPLRNFLCCTAK